MKKYLIVLLSIYSTLSISQEKEFLLKCVGDQVEYYNSNISSTQKREDMYLFEFNDVSNYWSIQKTTNLGNHDVIFPTKRFVGSDGHDFEHKIIVGKNLIINSITSIRYKGTNKLDFQEEINRLNGIWTVRSTYEYEHDGKKIIKKKSIDGQCNRSSRRI